MLQSLFNKIGSLYAYNLIRRTLVQVFLHSAKFVKFSRELFVELHVLATTSDMTLLFSVF